MATLIKEEWSIIVDEAARIEREKEARRIPRHPRTDLLEADLLRAIRILDQAGYKVIKDNHS